MKDLKEKVIVYLVYSDPCCEEDETCSCHSRAKDLEGIYFDRDKAELKAKSVFEGYVEESEIIS
jgi:hypothetical protein